MKKIVSERLAVNGILLILSLVIIFHLLVLTGVIPFSIVWGGRISNRSEMIKLESVSIFINVLMLLVIFLKAGIIRLHISPVILRILFGMMFALFILNTIGNLLSKDMIEKLVFTPLTLLLAIFSLRLAASRTIIYPKQNKSNS